MTIFSKLSDIISSNINALLEKASDPVKMSKLMIQEMQETLVEIKAAVAKVMADRKKVERLLEEKYQKKAYYDDKAGVAVDKSREDLAKRIIEEVIELEKEIENLQERKDHLDGVIEDYRSDIERLETKLDEARQKSKLLDERMKAAKQRKKVEDKLYKANNDGAFRRVEALEQQIEKLEAETEAMGLGTPSTLEEEIDELVHQDEVATRLAALKKAKSES